MCPFPVPVMVKLPLAEPDEGRETVPPSPLTVETPEEEMTEAELPDSVPVVPPPEITAAPLRDGSCPPPLT